MPHTRETVRALLASRDDAVERAIVVLFTRQTADEQASEETKHDNDVGFNSADARRLSYFARWIGSGRHLDGNHLVTARRRVMKYAGQLAAVANERALANA